MICVTESGSLATLVVTNAVAADTRNVTVSYTRPANKPIQDVPGNYAAGFSGQPVTIETRSIDPDPDPDPNPEPEPEPEQDPEE